MNSKLKQRHQLQNSNPDLYTRQLIDEVPVTRDILPGRHVFLTGISVFAETSEFWDSEIRSFEETDL